MSSELQNGLVVDCRDLLCPVPIIKLNVAIKQLSVGQTLEMTATDPGSIHDVKAWARQTTHELVEARKDGKEFTFIVKRTH